MSDVSAYGSKSVNLRREGLLLILTTEEWTMIKDKFLALEIQLGHMPVSMRLLFAPLDQGNRMLAGS